MSRRRGSAICSLRVQEAQSPRACNERCAALASAHTIRFAFLPLPFGPDSSLAGRSSRWPQRWQRRWSGAAARAGSRKTFPLQRGALQHSVIAGHAPGPRPCLSPSDGGAVFEPLIVVCRTVAFERITDEVVRQGMASFRPQGLTNLAWACATCGAADKVMVEMLLRCGGAGCQTGATQKSHLSRGRPVVCWRVCPFRMIDQGRSQGARGANVGRVSISRGFGQTLRVVCSAVIES